MSEISTVSLLTEKQDEYQAFLKKQVIQEPSDELLEIYERRVLTDFSYLRAEKFDSPEHQSELKMIQETTNSNKIPRNIQNSNFDRLMQLYDQIVEAVDLTTAQQLLIQLRDFLTGLGVIPAFEYQAQLYQPIFDVRCSEDLPMYFNYLLTKVANRLANKESN